jgi:hypothetical protein
MSQVSWQKAEQLVREKLGQEFNLTFKKGKKRIGEHEYEFDAVSEGGEIVAQVKTCRKKFEELTPAQLETRFKRDYMFDCLLLEKVKARRKFFYLVADEKLFHWFKEKSKDLIPEDVEVRFLNAWE